MSHRPFGPRLAPSTLPLHEEQIAVLNQALTDEVLRHAETRLKLQRMLDWYRLLESVEIVSGDEVDDA